MVVSCLSTRTMKLPSHWVCEEGSVDLWMQQVHTKQEWGCAPGHDFGILSEGQGLKGIQEPPAKMGQEPSFLKTGQCGEKRFRLVRQWREFMTQSQMQTRAEGLDGKEGRMVGTKEASGLMKQGKGTLNSSAPT